MGKVFQFFCVVFFAVSKVETELTFRSYNREEFLARLIFYCVNEKPTRFSVSRNDGHLLGIHDEKRKTWKYENGVFHVDGKTAKNAQEAFGLIVPENINVSINVEKVLAVNENLNENASAFLKKVFVSENRIKAFIAENRKTETVETKKDKPKKVKVEKPKTEAVTV